MRATIMYGPGDVRVENVPDSTIIEPTDALVVVTRAAICGSDLWPYRGQPFTSFGETGTRMDHEFIGIVEAVGSEVRTVKKGDLVAAPFAVSDGTCPFCQEGLHTSGQRATGPQTFWGSGGNASRSNRWCPKTLFLRRRF